MKLEELARQSAESARVSVAHLRPAEANPRGRARWVVPVTAMATILALLGLAIALSRSDAGDDPAETTFAGAPDVPRLGLGDQSAWTLIDTYDGASTGDELSIDIAFYGSSDPDDPFGSGDLVVALRPGLPSELVIDADDAAIEVHGVTGRVMSSAGDGIPAELAGIQWAEAGADGSTVIVQMLSRSMTSDQLVALATRSPYVAPSSTATGDLGRFDVAPDAGLIRLTSTDNLGFPAIGAVGRPGAASVVYSGEGTDMVLVVSTSAGNLDDDVMSLRWLDPTARRVEVAGQPGWQGAIDLSSDLAYVVQIVAWSPSPGVIAQVAATNAALSDAELIGLAESALPLSDAELAAALSQVDQPGEFATGSYTSTYAEVWAEGTGQVDDTAFSWQIGTQQDGVCMDVNVSDSGSGSCSSGDPITFEGPAQVYFQSFVDAINSVAIVTTAEVDDIVPSIDTGELHTFDSPDGTTWRLWFGPADVDVTFDVVVAGQTVATLDAAAMAEEPAGVDMSLDVDLSSNDSAVALGIVDSFVPLLRAGTDSDLVLGTVDDDLCVVSLAGADMAGCAPGDIVVVKPFPAPSGAERTVVMMRLPCDGVTFGEPSLVGLGDSGGQWGASGDEVALIAVDGTGGDLQLVVSIDGRAVQVDLPDVEGSVDWPADVCG